MELEQLRKLIDQVDEQLAGLFCERMRLCVEIAALKRREGLSLTDQAREEEILARVGAQAGAELEIYAREFFSTLFKLSKTYQARLTSAADEG